MLKLLNSNNIACLTFVCQCSSRANFCQDWIRPECNATPTNRSFNANLRINCKTFDSILDSLKVTLNGISQATWYASRMRRFMPILMDQISLSKLNCISTHELSYHSGVNSVIMEMFIVKSLTHRVIFEIPMIDDVLTVVNRMASSIHSQLICRCQVQFSYFHSCLPVDRVLFLYNATSDEKEVSLFRASIFLVTKKKKRKLENQAPKQSSLMTRCQISYYVWVISVNYMDRKSSFVLK